VNEIASAVVLGNFLPNTSCFWPWLTLVVSANTAREFAKIVTGSDGD